MSAVLPQLAHDRLAEIDFDSELVTLGDEYRFRWWRGSSKWETIGSLTQVLLNALAWVDCRNTDEFDGTQFATRGWT